MALRAFKPTSAGRRFYTVSDFAEITRDEPESKLTEPKPRTGGRNHYGRITSRFRGGGHKQAYRLIDFKRQKIGVPAKGQVDVKETLERSVDSGAAQSS